MIGLVVFGLAASLGLFFIVSRNPSPAPPAATVVTEAPTPVAEPAPEAPAAKSAARVPHPVVGADPAGELGNQTPEQRQEAYVAARSAELMDLAMNDDSDSLTTILSELANRNPKIRQAAVEAAVQFHSRDAIPRLQDAALQTNDAKERAAIQEAIEFLKLPTLTEVLQEQARQAAGGGGTNPPPAR